MLTRQFVAYFWFVGWWAFSLGFHVDFKSPNIEVHMPFGFLRIGWQLRTRHDSRFGILNLNRA